MVAPHRSLYYCLAHRAHLVINPTDEPSQLVPRLRGPPGNLSVLAAEMHNDIGVGLVRFAGAFRAVHLHARAATSKRGLVVGSAANESADIHPLRAVATQAALDVNFPLPFLHVEENLVVLEGLVSQEQSRREHARVDGRTVDVARPPIGGGQHHVHTVFHARGAIVTSLDVIELSRRETYGPAGVAGPGGGGVASGVGH